MRRDLGAISLGEGRTRFRVWAPDAERVEVLLPGTGRAVAMEREGRGYHRAEVDGAPDGTRYRFRLDGGDGLPDPASRHQPEGVHGPSAVVDHGSYWWTDDGWFGLPLDRLVISELHVGTFSREGTFAGIIPWLDELAALGVTAIELMPVAQFPGSRNWGYDGVFPYAVQDSYGGPEGLRDLVDACHGRGLAVVLDVVYNHFGPEGSVLRRFGPYFTDRYRTAWGEAVNVDGPWSDEVREYLIGNALAWFRDYHVDALRLDAVHAIFDITGRPFLLELSERVEELAHRLNRRLHLIAESDLGDVRVITPREMGGLGMDAQWSDDFHHAVHSLLTGEREGYYEDFGSIRHLAKVLREGYAYTGQHSPARNRRHGSAARPLPADRFVVCVQNHDQVGNRATGDRLTALVKFDDLKLAAGVLILSPFVPLLFMGEEYGEPAPFPYFVSHTDPDLVEAVRRGRREEFAEFAWQGEPPDPQAEVTFRSAVLNRKLRHEGEHRTLWELHGELLRLRREVPALARLSKDHLEVEVAEPGRMLTLRRWTDGDEAFAAFNFGDGPASVRLPEGPAPWRPLLRSASERWGGPDRNTEEASPAGEGVKVPAHSFALFARAAGEPP